MKEKMVKNIMVFGITASFLFLVFPNITIVNGDDPNFITITATLNDFYIKQTENGDEIFAENFGRLLVEGQPNIPSRIYSIAIPPGASVTNIIFETDETIILPGTYTVPACPTPDIIGEVDYSKNEGITNNFEENFNQIYNNDDPYPDSIGEFLRRSYYRKYDLVDIRINPFTYYPLSGVLEYNPEIDIIIYYDLHDETLDNNIDNIVRTEAIAERIIINYEQAQQWYQHSPKIGRGLHDYVIITLDSLINSVNPIVNWEESKGRNVKVVTTTWIDTNYNGYDLEEKMRNFLRDKYPSSEWGIEDVLLVGHYDDVKIRRTWQDVGYGKPETDFYYAELSLPDNQSWDANGNHRYGENSDPIDFYAEVNVGRIPFNNPSTVLDICDKSVLYEQNNDPSFKKNILLLGAYFWDNTDNAVLMEEIASQPWMTDWNKTRMYEQGHSTYPMDYDLRYNNVQTVWSSGTYAFVNWAGHGSPTSCHIWYSSPSTFVDTNTCNYLNDDYPAIIFADACSNQDTDQFNLGQGMMQQGGIGFLGATKVAYGMPAWNDPYDGSSQSLDYFFTTLITSGNYTQGQAHQWALTHMYQNGLWYYNKFETFEWGALLGNPNLGMFSYQAGNQKINIANLSEGWNFISLPSQLSLFQPVMSKYSCIVNYSNTDYSWSDAVANGYINDIMFGWDRSGQYYDFENSFLPGEGYWMYAYEDLVLQVILPSNLPQYTGYISDLNNGWNIVGLPDDEGINKINTYIQIADNDYTWLDAVNLNIINDYIFGWNQITQTYIFSDSFLPGEAYWIYAYVDCVLKDNL